MQDAIDVSILLVDDNPKNLLSMEALLDDPSLHVVKASSGNEALKCVLDTDFAAILLDVRMPGMDGFETAERIRARPSSHHTPILFITAYSRDEADLRRGYGLGAVDFLYKPIVTEILCAKVGVFVELFRKTEELREAERRAVEHEIVEERRRAEADLKAIGTYAQDIVDTVREPLLMLDTTLRVQSANRAFYQTFHVSPAETENHLIYELGNGQWDIPDLRTLLEDVVPKSSVFNDFELEHKFPVIGRRVMLLNARQLLAGSHAELLVLAMEDVTERRRAEEEVAAAKERLAEHQRQEAVLDERNRIAREIHDTLAQSFAGILLQSRVARRIADKQPEEAWSLIEYVSELAQQGLMEARRSVWDLQPEAMEYRDLARALSMNIERQAPGAPAQIELRIHGSQRDLPPSIGMDLFRIGQEALTNALRHAQSRTVTIDLTFEAEQIVMRVHDDGQGFDLSHQSDSGGFGLVSMSQRSERIGGRLTIASRPGQGTEVAVWAPIAPIADCRN
jgi:signal transduction histidine kinase/DNA-binding response OmpR family regulator